MVKISSAQLPIKKYEGFEKWALDIKDWIQQAANNESQLLLLPEYGSLSLTSLLSESSLQSTDSMLKAMQNFLPDFHRIFLSQAQKYNMIIIGSSFPTLEKQALYNRAFVYTPQGIAGFQDKTILTRFEREKTSIKAGKTIKTFEAPFGRFGIAICFDCEFPLIVRQMVDANANLILVPSCTGTMRGFHRVRIGCQARALENQIPVVQSVTVGDAPWQPIADTNHGAAAFYGPADNDFPEDGIIKMGNIDEESLVHMDLDFKAFENIRKNGHVLNWSYWDEQKEVKYQA